MPFVTHNKPFILISSSKCILRNLHFAKIVYFFSQHDARLHGQLPHTTDKRQLGGGLHELVVKSLRRGGAGKKTNACVREKKIERKTKNHQM